MGGLRRLAGGVWECPSACAECCANRALPFPTASCQQMIKSFNLRALMLIWWPYRHCSHHICGKPASERKAVSSHRFPAIPFHGRSGKTDGRAQPGAAGPWQVATEFPRSRGRARMQLGGCGQGVSGMCRLPAGRSQSQAGPQLLPAAPLAWPVEWHEVLLSHMPTGFIFRGCS